MDAKKTGQYIKRKRTELGLSQQKLAELLEVEPQTISKWERGLGMPDYGNVDKLKEIFHCSLTDILEPQDGRGEEEAAEAEADETAMPTLPVLYEMFGEQQKNQPKKKFRFFDFLSKKKIKEAFERTFGAEYENVATDKIFGKTEKRKHTKKEYETLLTQGMFTDDPDRTVLGDEKPWLWKKVFRFLFICTIASLVVAIFLGSPSTFTIVGSLCAAVPLTLLLFELNYKRDVSLFSLMAYFVAGGVGSILLTLIFQLSSSHPVFVSVVLAPLAEELAKAVAVLVIFKRVKPKSILTGILIGFTVGAGFDFFENILYADEVYAASVYQFGDGFLAMLESVTVLTSRVRASFFSGHHFFAGIFSGLFVAYHKGEIFRPRQLLKPKNLALLLIPIALHALWNLGATLVELGYVVWGCLFLLLDMGLCISGLIVVINIGIAQWKVQCIRENKAAENADTAQTAAV